MNRQRYLFVALILTGVGVMSCAERHDVTAPGTTIAAEEGSQQPLRRALRLLACDPEPYDSVVQTVGPQGGTIHAGPNTLVIPAGALDATTTITAVVPADTLAAIRFAPEGLTFALPAALTMSFAGCPLAGLVIPRWVVYTDSAWSILEVERSVLHPLHESVTGRISHFSGYAVAY
ncbi:MAG: hypothetical protein ACREN3_02105 [Gemmatimonadaceae bacterium]